MSLCLKILACIVVVISLYYQNYFTLLKRGTANGSVTLIIGILSARENFEQRAALRSTWLKNLPQNQSIKFWFIIGDQFCPIPRGYRLSEYGCERLNVNVTGITESFYTSHEEKYGNCPPNSSNVFHQGFSFQVYHPMVIKKLGILKGLLVPTKEAKVALLDLQTKEIITEAEITYSQKDVRYGYAYSDVEPILLPKGYQGLILVEGYLHYSICKSATLNNGSGVISIQRIFPTANYLESIKVSETISVAASISFSVQGLDSLKSFINEESLITDEWQAYQQKIGEKLMLEMQQNKDILLVNVMETYRNLPIKLLHFYKWIVDSYDFSYVMKTDDDCTVDIPRILNTLQNDVQYQSSKPWLWSKFRREWPINYIGKWADFDFQASIYPSFPCGAGYIMSKAIIQWLSLNYDVLFPYQGEDVSTGIWLSAIKPIYIDDENWACGSECNSKSYNRAQLSVKEIHDAWSIYEKCNNLCTCDNI